MYSLSNYKFSLCQFTSFVTITYTKLTKQTYPASKNIWKFSLQILKYTLPLESGNLQLEQTKFPVFWQNFQIPYVFPDRELCWPFSLFSLSSGYPVISFSKDKMHICRVHELLLLFFLNSYPHMIIFRYLGMEIIST